MEVQKLYLFPDNFPKIRDHPISTSHFFNSTLFKNISFGPFFVFKFDHDGYNKIQFFEFFNKILLDQIYRKIEKKAYDLLILTVFPKIHILPWNCT